MTTRSMFNTPFYTDSPGRCQKWIDRLVSELNAEPVPAGRIAGIVPHAGWTYSGSTAVKVWLDLQKNAQPETLILFGAVHYPGITAHTAYPEGAWQTPIGPAAVDAALATKLMDELSPFLRPGFRAHDREHSLEVHIPFIRALFPDSRILPIATPSGQDAARLGRRIGELTQGLPVVAVGSTDLTHYGERFRFTPKGFGPGAHDWMRANDQRMLDRILALRDDEVEEEAAAHHNACGPGAVAATLAFAKAHGRTRGTLLERTDSHEVEDGGPFEMAVGYAGVAF